jgi:hypothetical protein
VRGLEQNIDKFQDQSLIIEMDAQMVVKAIQDKNCPRNY